MKQILTVCGFTFKDAIRKKAFIISTIIMFVLILGLSFIPKLVGSDSEGDSGAGNNVAVTEKSKTCYYIDDSGLIPDGDKALADAFPDYNVIVKASSDIPSLKDLIKENDSHSMVEVKNQNGTPFITVTTKSFMYGMPAQEAVDTLSNKYIANSLKGEGISEEQIALIQSKLPFTSEIAGEMQFSGYVMGILLTFLIFFSIYYYGYGVAMSVATEKTSRVMETLLVSAKPSRILIGKCLGMGLLGLSQFVAVVLFTVACIKLFIPEGFTIMGMPISFEAFTPASATLIFVFFILGYVLYAVMNAVCGALVSKIEDLNSAMMPVMFIALIAFYLAYGSAVAGTSSGIVQKIAMYVPFSAPFLFPFKLLNESINPVDVTISIAVLVASIVAISALSIKIYSASVMHYGKRLKLKDAYKTNI